MQYLLHPVLEHTGKLYYLRVSHTQRPLESMRSY